MRWQEIEWQTQLWWESLTTHQRMILGLVLFTVFMVVVF